VFGVASGFQGRAPGCSGSETICWRRKSRASAGATRCHREAPSKPSAKPVSRNDRLIESARRALKSYTCSGALCPPRET